MPRVDAPLTKAAIYVYYDDHAPPHFHVLGPDTDVLIDLRTLQVMRGRYTRQALAEAIAWAADNLTTLWSEWRRCNERD